MTHDNHLPLTHWGPVTHICVSKQTIIGSDNGLSPGQRQAIIWTNAGILLIGTLGTNFSEILIKILIFSFKKMGLKVSSAKWRPFCPGLNVLALAIHQVFGYFHQIDCADSTFQMAHVALWENVSNVNIVITKRFLFLISVCKFVY